MLKERSGGKREGEERNIVFWVYILNALGNLRNTEMGTNLSGKATIKKEYVGHFEIALTTDMCETCILTCPESPPDPHSYPGGKHISSYLHQTSQGNATEVKEFDQGLRTSMLPRQAL